jgi:DNA-binding transcriptional LysR family regulator
MHPNALDHLRTFNLVVSEGSFSKAARKLGRGVSAVSYTIGVLERQLGFPLFDRTSREPALTRKGQVMAREGELLLRRVERLEARLRALQTDTETSLTLAVDAAFPEQVLLDGLVRFEAAYPFVAIHLRRMGGVAVRDAVFEGQAQIGLMAIERGIGWDRIEGREILAETMLLVAAPGHPVANIQPTLTLSDLDNHRQIYLADGGNAEEAADYRVHPTDVWVVSSLDAQLGLVERGMGWAFIPDGAAAPALARGTIAVLACPDILHAPIRRFSAIRLITQPLGEAADRRVDELARP